MKFYVVRTSRETPPCKEAKCETVTIKHDYGKTFTSDEWFVEINTLDELIKFYNEYGDIIIADYWYDPKQMVIEIYDDYRE